MRQESRFRQGLYHEGTQGYGHPSTSGLQGTTGFSSRTSFEGELPREFYLANDVGFLFSTARIFPLRAVEALYPSQLGLYLREKAQKHPLRGVLHVSGRLYPLFRSLRC